MATSVAARVLRKVNQYNDFLFNLFGFSFIGIPNAVQSRDPGVFRHTVFGGPREDHRFFATLSYRGRHYHSGIFGVLRLSGVCQIARHRTVYDGQQLNGLHVTVLERVLSENETE